MTDYPILTLKAGKDVSVRFCHPWIFSGALSRIPRDLPHGSLVHVADSNGDILGTGTFSKYSSIAIRVLDIQKTAINTDWFVKKITQAHQRRLALNYGPKTETTGYRVVFGEADGIPGLVVDRYDEALVFQIATAGMDLLRESVVEALTKIFKPRLLVERSDIGVRAEEKLESVKTILINEQSASNTVSFLENGLPFQADLLNGQKTGFFLDQKNLRSLLRDLSKGQSVLNLFSYTGATSAYVLAGGAKGVINVDSSAPALALCPTEKSQNIDADIFDYLSAPSSALFDMVVMDPPALIKSRHDVNEGRKAYHFLNRQAMSLVRDGGLFVSSSCSRFMPEEDLSFTLRKASVQAGVRMSVVAMVRQSPDHPVSLYFPESAYLKSFVCRVER